MLWLGLLLAIYKSSVVQKNGIKLETKSGGATIKGVTCGNISLFLDFDGDQVTLVFDESKAENLPGNLISGQEEAVMKSIETTLSIYGKLYAKRREVISDELKARKERKIIWN